MRLTALTSIFFTVPILHASAQAPLPLLTSYDQPTSLALAKMVGVNFDGIGHDDCSGSVVRFEKSKPTDLALYLSAGHCVDFAPAQTYLFHSSLSNTRSFTLLSPSGQDIGKVDPIEILYSSMTKTDLALYVLDTTFGELERKFGVHALTLSSQHPTVGTPVDVISGALHKAYHCKIEAFIPHLKESLWTWDDSLRYSRPGCEIELWSSGSPVVIAGTSTIIGINTTWNVDGYKCSQDNPCEVDSSGNIEVHKGYSYAQETYLLTTCLNSVGDFDINVESCQLFH